MLLEGTLLRGRSFDPVEGRIVVEDGTISAVEENPRPQFGHHSPGVRQRSHPHRGLDCEGGW